MKQTQRLQNRARDVLFPPLLSPYWRRKLNGKVICLLYHRVDSPENNLFLTVGGSPVISPSDLRQELQFLKRQGAVFLTFADLRRGFFPGRSEFGVIVSFDDCFLDNYTKGLEVLEDLGIKAVFFQTTGMLKGGELIWEHALYWFNRSDQLSSSFSSLARKVLIGMPDVAELNGSDLVFHLREHLGPPEVNELLSSANEELCRDGELAQVAERVYATAENVRTAHRLGHEIGSHGHQHYKRANIDEQMFEQELRRSAEALRRILGAEPKVFSYPFNSYSASDESVCSRYFRQAATVDAKYIDRDTKPMWLPRFSWPGPTKNSFRRRRWLLTGGI